MNIIQLPILPRNQSIKKLYQNLILHESEERKDHKRRQLAIKTRERKEERRSNVSKC